MEEVGEIFPAGREEGGRIKHGLLGWKREGVVEEDPAGCILPGW